MNKIALGIATPFVIYGIITILHIVLPARKVKGYVLPRYRLNGLAVLGLSVLLWAAAGYFRLVPLAWLYEVRFSSLAGAFVLGIGFSLILVLPHKSTGKNLFADFYFGRLDNPQLGTGFIDAKMWLYLTGAVMLELNVLSFAAWHINRFGVEGAGGVLMAAAMISWFVVDYLTFEEVHLFTYDFFAEKVGFKLGWGCLVFYPFFYTIPLFSTVHLPDSHSPLLYRILSVLLFLGGWTLARGANMQKFYFKTRPERKFLGISPETITDGEKSLLVSGFWGLSRHINYLGEILMASGIVLAAGYPSHVLPWLYPLYYVALLFPRQHADDKRCASKYGELWKRYEAKVPYRIIPFLY